MLIDAGLTRDRLEECRRVAGTTGESLDRVILTKDYLDEVTLLSIYAKDLCSSRQQPTEPRVGAYREAGLPDVG